MKKCLFLLLITALLTGCTAEDTFETISDELIQPVIAQPRFICVDLPGETALPVVESDHGRVYVCNDYEIVLQTVQSGDLAGTMEMMSGLTMEDLTVMQTQTDDIERYEFVWAAVGEGGDRGGRGVILDDHNYHYCMSVLRSTQSEEKSQINWDDVFSSFCLA